ncbi:hypothetical protein NMY22_g13259 [Coprinellus aureogranulatus]|nr:hypothetical protein NMY22_g13259 [Coprinellus aureogranulatus]
MPGPPQTDAGRAASRSNKYYYEFVVFEVRHIVPRREAMGHELVSKLPPISEIEGNGDGATDDNPIRLSGAQSLVTPRKQCSNAECLALFISEGSGSPTFSKEEWIGVLKLGRLWDMPKATSLAIENLSTFKMGAIEKIQLGKAYAVSTWMKDGYTKLIGDPNDDTVFEEFRLLGLETTNRILLARDKVQPKVKAASANPTYFYCNTCISRNTGWSGVGEDATTCTQCGSSLSATVILVTRPHTSWKTCNVLFDYESTLVNDIDRKVEELFGEEIKEAERENVSASN